MKDKQIQRADPRQPRQQRSRYKVELILEATMRLLETGGVEHLTTNAVAATAGVSIGTLYQYFPDKRAILDALADREVAAMSARVMAAMADASIATPRQRIAAVVGAVAESYGRRHRAHRLVMTHSLRGTGRLSPLLSSSMAFLATKGPAGGPTGPIDSADAFVLTHAFAGVLRAMIGEGADAPHQKDIERALIRLVVSFFGLEDSA
jgi:AcrR family transcriptional regulator